MDNDDAVKEEPKTAEEIASSTLPTEASTEDTAKPENEAFAAMRTEIKELKDQLKSREELSTTYETPRSFTPPTPTYQPQQSNTWGQQQVDPNAFRDPITGEIDEYRRTQAVNQAIVAAQNNATANAQSFASNLVKDEVDWAVARMKYPELDTNQEFAEDVWGQYLIERQRNPEATPIDVVNKVKGRWDRLSKQEAKAIDKEADKAVLAKEEASLDASGQAPSVSKQVEEQEEEEEDELLRQRSRGVVGNAFSGTKVSKEEQELALIERLKKKSWASPLEETT